MGRTCRRLPSPEKNGVEVKLLSARVARPCNTNGLASPDKNGKLADCVFGFDDMPGYESEGQWLLRGDGWTGGQPALRAASLSLMANNTR